MLAKDDPAKRREYRRRWREKDRKRARAKVRRDYRRKALRNIGLTEEGYQELLSKQGGVCAICKKPDPRAPDLCLDHDHETGLLRGLLCHSCNRGLGLLGDTLEALKAAAQYLEATESGKDKRAAWQLSHTQRGAQRKTHCKWGHKFTPKNTYVNPRGARECRRCRNARMKEWYMNNRYQAKISEAALIR